jgi:DNA-binding LacI/PurR family transcriptional regulator
VGGFVDTLKAQAKVFDPAGRRSIVAYTDIDTHSDNENFLQLIHDVQERRLAGLIYVYSSTELHDPAFRENCDIPSVTITNGQAPSWLPAIGFATPVFMERAIRHLASLSRKRVAGISMWTHTMGDHETQLGPIVKKSGMSTQPFWWQAPNLHDPPAISRCVQLMFQGSPSTRPDALIVGDDNLVGPVCDGIVAAGLRVPTDVAIVAHACFPHPTPCRLPAVRLGPDVGALLRLAVEFIDLQAKGKPVPSRTLTPPVFADEVQTAAVRV